jgi:hypothetical protein
LTFVAFDAKPLPQVIGRKDSDANDANDAIAG